MKNKQKSGVSNLNMKKKTTSLVHISFWWQKEPSFQLK